MTLLCFDDKYCTIVRNSITPNLFESSVFREIATHAIDFIDQFKEAIKDHLPDSLEHILQGDDKRKASSYSRVLDNLYLAKDGVNGEYVVSKIHQFVRQQNFKGALVKAVEAIEAGQIDQAEVEMQKGLNSQVMAFEMGSLLSDPTQSLQFFDEQDYGIHTGIKELDRHDICPRPQELFLFIAPPKKGKSWALIHAGKNALLQRKKVLHITLEMSERRCNQRYMQSIFAIAKRHAEVNTPIFTYGEDGKMVSIDHEVVIRPTLADPKMRIDLSKRVVDMLAKKSPLIVKQFPTGSLTINQLKAYLDGLERFHKFIPDMLIIDYPDLMAIDSANLRLDTGKIYKDLRGLAIERNLALVTASQGSKDAAKARLVTGEMVSEDYSKIATADNVVTYTQTKEEKILGIARLFVAAGRNDEDKFEVLISQAYPTGQFCLDSTMMKSNYWDQIDELAYPKRKKDDDDDD